MWWRKKKEEVAPSLIRVNLEFKDGPFTRRDAGKGAESILFRIRGEALWAISPEMASWLVDNCRGKYGFDFLWPKYRDKKAFIPGNLTLENPEELKPYRALGVQFRFTDMDDALRFKLAWK